MMVFGGDDVVLNILYLYIYHTQNHYFIYFHTAYIHKDVHYIFLRTGYTEKCFKFTELIEVPCTTYS